MACNCKREKRFIEIGAEGRSSDDVESGGFLDYMSTVGGYIVLGVKMFLICVLIILAMPFITLFVLWGFLSEGQVTIKVPELLKEKK